MKAVAIEEFGGEPKLLDLPAPTAGPGELLVDLYGAAISPIDRLVALGALQHMRHVFPFVLGSDGAGVVAAVGEGVTRFAPGDRVYGIFMHEPLGRGTLAEQVVVPEEAMIAKAPEKASLVEVAAAPNAAMTAIGVVEASEPGPGDVVLIIGASGGVGSFAIQLAAARGARVIATARPESTEWVQGLGATDVVDHTAGSLAEGVQELAPDGVDVLYELVGDAAAFAVNTELLREGGRAISTRYAAPFGETDGGPVTTVNFGLREYPDIPGLLGRLGEEIDSNRLSIPIGREVDLTGAAVEFVGAGAGPTRGKTLVAIRPDGE